MSYWIAYVVGGRPTFCLLLIAGVIYGVVLRSSSLGRSLWLDEAWVANSVSAHTLGGTFYYSDWLQSSPPLFLILVRAAVALFGLNNTVLRAVPSALGILAIALMLALVLRVLSRQYALLAWLLLVLSPTAVTYSVALKQYSAELAATTAIVLISVLYIEHPSPRRFWLLVLIVVMGFGSGYAVAFLLPGIALMIWMTPFCSSQGADARLPLSRPFARALLFSAIMAAMVIGEYCVFVIPNSPAVLRADWANKNKNFKSFASLAASDSYLFVGELPLNHRFDQQTIRLAGTGLTIAAGLALSFLRFRKGRRKYFEIQVVCLLPCLFLLISDWFNWYPFTDRTSLFALPCLIVLIVSSLQLLFLLLIKGGRRWLEPLAKTMAFGAIVVTLNAGWAKTPRHIKAYEDMDGATSFLQAHVTRQDFLWVHSSCTEAFKLYATMKKWQDSPVHFGHTAFPCCPRGLDPLVNTSSEALVRMDFGKALPTNFSGRVWLLYTTRREHWRPMADEPEIMEAILRERGCTQTPISPPVFTNVKVVSFDCQSDNLDRFAPQVSQSRSPDK